MINQPLRQQLRQARRSLSPQQQVQAANNVCEQLWQLDAIKECQHLALYLPNDGELDPTPLLSTLWQHQISTYLPVLCPDNPGHLRFVRYHSDTPMTRNRFGIAEPKGQSADIEPQALDVVLVPLVGFDHSGARLGMGGGYYDRTFAFKQSLPNNSKPQLIGLAHQCQRVEHLPSSSWDIPMQLIISDRTL